MVKNVKEKVVNVVKFVKNVGETVRNIINYVRRLIVVLVNIDKIFANRHNLRLNDRVIDVEAEEVK